MKENNNNDFGMFSKESLETAAKHIKKMFYGNPVNKDPLTEIPTPQMRLYSYLIGFNSVFFDTEKELKKYKKNHSTAFGDLCTIEFLGNVAGRSDVIRIIYESGKSDIRTACDEDGYSIYNFERSVYEGKFIWEYSYGSIEEIYSAFRARGIIFENDVYGEIDKRNQKIIKMLKSKNLN